MRITTSSGPDTNYIGVDLTRVGYRDRPGRQPTLDFATRHILLGLALSTMVGSPVNEP